MQTLAPEAHQGGEIALPFHKWGNNRNYPLQAMRKARGVLGYKCNGQLEDVPLLSGSVSVVYWQVSVKTDALWM